MLIFGGLLVIDLISLIRKKSDVAQSCLTLCEPVDCSRPGSSVHGTLQARVLEWVAICFRGSSWPRDWTWVFQIVGRCFIIWATRDVHLISLIAVSLFRTSVSSWAASLLAQRVKNLPAMQETWIWSLGQENPLEKGMATHTSILAWRIQWTEELGSV